MRIDYVVLCFLIIYTCSLLLDIIIFPPHTLAYFKQATTAHHYNHLKVQTSFTAYCYSRINYMYIHTVLSQASTHGRSQLKHQNLRVGSYVENLLMVRMNKLCELIHNYIHEVYRKSEYIPIVTNFVSILALFSVEDNSSTTFCSKFLRSTCQVLPKKFWTNGQKKLCWLWVTKKATQKFM